MWKPYLYGLVQDYSNSSANALELLQSCTKPSISFLTKKITQDEECCLGENK